MTEWVKEILYTYVDPDNVGGGGTIAIVEFAYEDDTGRRVRAR